MQESKEKESKEIERQHLGYQNNINYSYWAYLVISITIYKRAIAWKVQYKDLFFKFKQYLQDFKNQTIKA